MRHSEPASIPSICVICVPLRRMTQPSQPNPKSRIRNPKSRLPLAESSPTRLEFPDNRTGESNSAGLESESQVLEELTVIAQRRSEKNGVCPWTAGEFCDGGRWLHERRETRSDLLMRQSAAQGLRSCRRVLAPGSGNMRECRFGYRSRNGYQPGPGPGQ